MKKDLSEKKNTDPTKATTEIDVRDLIRSILKNWRLGLSIASIVFFCGLVYAIFATTWYTAQVRIMPNFGQGEHMLSQYSNLASLAGINMPNETGNNFYLYPDIITSNFILNRVLEHKYNSSIYKEPTSLYPYLDIEYDTTEVNWKHKLKEKAKKLIRQEYIKTFLNDETDLLHIYVNVPKDPILAAELANYILQLLEVYNNDIRHYKARDQKQFINNSLIETQNNLHVAEDNLKLFLDKNKDINAPATKLVYEKYRAELTLQRKIYLELRKQMELAKIQEIKETETLNVLDKAVVPIEKSKPKRTFIVLIFGFIGLVLGISAIFIKEYISNFRQL